MNFSTLQGLTIPEGVVTQIAKDGVVLWKLETSKPIILEVEKIVSKTYVSSTSYESEEFILLDIYPETSDSVVNVTYGGLTKTLTFNGTNAKQVYFGTFGGVSDGVATPKSGSLTIDGGCIGVGCGSYNKDKSTTAYAKGCITNIAEWGGVKTIPKYAFESAKNLISAIIPNGVTTIGEMAFDYCVNLTDVSIPNGVTTIENGSFSVCTSLRSVTIPSSVNNIGNFAFNLTSTANCNRTVYILSNTPATTGGTKIFGDVGYTTIVVPKGCGNTYKNADGWNTYADYIVEAS